MRFPALLLAPLLALAPSVDGGAPDGGVPLLPMHPLQVRNLGATTVHLQVLDAQGRVRWGPYALDTHETVELHYCPTAGLSLSVKSIMRKAPLSYALERLVALKVSEDRWSEGDPLRVYDAEDVPLTGTCERSFTAGR